MGCLCGGAVLDTVLLAIVHTMGEVLSGMLGGPDMGLYSPLGASLLFSLYSQLGHYFEGSKGCWCIGQIHRLWQTQKIQCSCIEGHCRS